MLLPFSRVLRSTTPFSSGTKVGSQVETWLREIFDNLIANSKYTHPVGREYGAVVVKFKDGRRFVGVVSGTEHSISGRPIFSMLNKSVRRWFFPIWSDVQQITIAHTHPDYKGEKIIAFHSDLDLIFGDFLKKYIRKKSGRDIPIRSLVLPLGINENLVFESNL